MAISREKSIAAFLRVSGYKDEDILGVNTDTLTFTTINGGKYRLSRDGKNVQRLSGPQVPSASVPLEVEEETETTEES